MPRRRTRPLLPHELLHPLQRVLGNIALLRRTVTEPYLCQTPEQPWAPMDDDEWAVLVPKLRDHLCGIQDPWQAGRHMIDNPRARLDAIFRLVTLTRPDGSKAPWRELPPEHGKPDTVHRSFRRWTARGLWMALLPEVAHALDCEPDSPFARLAWRIICAFRRGIRIMGIYGILMARRLRLYSALHRPSHLLPDPDLSEHYAPVFLAGAEWLRNNPGQAIPPPIRRWYRRLLRLWTGARPWPRYLQDPEGGFGVIPSGIPVR